MSVGQGTGRKQERLEGNNEQSQSLFWDLSVCAEVRAHAAS